MSNPWPQAPEGASNHGAAAGKCPHCGSGDVATGLAMNQNADVGSIGLRYKTGFLFLGTEQLYADLCLTCGSVVRFFVKEAKRNWVQ